MTVLDRRRTLPHLAPVTYRGGRSVFELQHVNDCFGDVSLLFYEVFVLLAVRNIVPRNGTISRRHNKHDTSRS